MDEKSTKICFWITLILLLISLFYIRHLLKQNFEITDHTIELNHRIDSCNYEISKLKLLNDSSVIIIDSAKKEIVYINKEYEKDFNKYLSQPTDSDAVQFAEYILSEDPGRFFSSNNSPSTKIR